MRRIADLTAKKVVSDGKQCVKLRYRICFGGGEKNDNSVVIYRREEKGYTFRKYGKEYFDGMLPTKDDIIFKGEILPEYSYAEFIDYDVEINKIYVYWIGTDDSLKWVSAPTPVKVRDPYIWWSFEEITNKMQSLAERFPNAEIINVGETVGHKPLNVLAIGNRENIIALVGAVHACETGPEILLPFAEDMLTNFPHLLEKTGIAILPSANADGREQMVEGAPWSIRKNKNGVDLNRNFESGWEEISYYYGWSSAVEEGVTYRGLYPNSEPETRAMINMVEIIKPKAVLSYHWLCSVTGDSALSSKKAFTDNNTEFIKRLDVMSRIYCDAFRDCAGEKRIEAARANYGACTGGSLATWLYDRDIISLDFEAGDFWNEGMLKGAEFDLTTREQLDLTLKYHTAGLKALLEADFK